MPTEDLGLIIKSDKARRIIYGVYVVAVIIAGAVQVGYASVHLGQPDWLTAALAVLAYLGAPIGGLAIVNAGVRPVMVTQFASSAPTGMGAGAQPVVVPAPVSPTGMAP